MSSATAILPERGRLTMVETLADSRVMAARQLRKITRRPMYVGYLFVQPVMFVLLFRYVFGSAINTGHVSYVNFLLPGIIVMTAVMGALTTGLGLTEDVASGVVDRFRSLPIARSAVLVGRTVADLATNAVTLVVMVLIGLAIGFRPTQPAYQVALALVLVLAFAYVFSWVSAFIGVSVRNPETAQSIGFIWVFPLVFASSAFVPTTHMRDHEHQVAELRLCSPDQQHGDGDTNGDVARRLDSEPCATGLGFAGGAGDAEPGRSGLGVEQVSRPHHHNGEGDHPRERGSEVVQHRVPPLRCTGCSHSVSIVAAVWIAVMHNRSSPVLVKRCAAPAGAMRMSPAVAVRRASSTSKSACPAWTMNSSG